MTNRNVSQGVSGKVIKRGRKLPRTKGANAASNDRAFLEFMTQLRNTMAEPIPAPALWCSSLEFKQDIKELEQWQMIVARFKEEASKYRSEGNNEMAGWHEDWAAEYQGKVSHLIELLVAKYE